MVWEVSNRRDQLITVLKNTECSDKKEKYVTQSDIHVKRQFNRE